MRRPDRPTVLFLLGLVFCALLLLAGGTRAHEARSDPTPADTTDTADTARAAESSPPGDAAPEGAAPPVAPPERVLPRDRMLVAYYGTAGTGSLGVLGEAPPAAMHRRLLRAARAFERPGVEVQPVWELIVTVADAAPGPDGDHSHDIARADVRRYVEAARRHGALLLLDLQPGRSGFLEVARRWTWALREPHVGLALDPEWRMGPTQVPGRVIGSVRAAEVNRVSGWLALLTRHHRLPEKLLVLHQFRASMLPDVERVRERPGLQLVQHVDGFGTPGQKLDTYRAVARPGRFAMGFKLFYDEDRPRMSARDVLRVRPGVRFVSFQ